jgi:DNA-binding transcriptional MerR regulator
MAYTVKKLAETSGVSIRTLRFYDEIGLLRPARIGDNGYRYYEEEQLLLLQQILFYRELGFPLNDIQAILHKSSFDKITALNSHRKLLTNSVEKTTELIATIDRTIARLKGDKSMSDHDLYKGFSHDQQTAYEQELIARYGESAQARIAQSKQNTKGWTRDDYRQVAADYDAIHAAMTAQLNAGAPVKSPEVMAIVRQHYDLVCRFWQPDAASYAGLGQLYIDHPDFRKLYDSWHPGLAAYLAEAMKEFASRSDLTDG